MLRALVSSSALLALGACATVERTPDGAVLEYLRTNSDGSEPERIVVHSLAAGQVAVFKERSRCTNAAYVTAQLDANGQARGLVGGSLTRELTQERFAWLTYTDGRLAVRPGAPDAAVQQAVAVAEQWVLYDFDFADLIAAPPAEVQTGEALSFDLPLIMVTDDGFTLTNRGRLTLTPVGSSDHRGVPARRYRAHGPALGTGEGELWFRVGDGRLLEARLPIPNHAEYRDFRLQLTGEQRGATAWRAVLADHWADCPVAD